MFLSKLYAEPSGLFEPIEFIDGVNFIYGRKDSKDDPKKSLNGIGKSTLLDLLDFCLLASYQENHNPRLCLLGQRILMYTIVLEFEANNQIHIIRRNFEKPNEVEYGVPGKISKFSVNDAKAKLFELIFNPSSYCGVSTDKWFRNLMLFFLKIQKHKKSKFLDPIQYIKELSVAELNQLHFFLMRIDNSVIVENFGVQESLKRKQPALREVKSLVENNYRLTEIKEANNEINRLKREIESITVSMESFKLAEQYADAERDANGITEQIKALWHQNFSDREKIKGYGESCRPSQPVSKIKIGRLYAEYNQLLGERAKKSLDDVIKFNKELSESREMFITQEIERLTGEITVREEKIKELEEVRAKLFAFLSTKGAINDLTEGYSVLNSKKARLADLEGKLRTYNSLQLEVLELEESDKKIAIKVKKFLDAIQSVEISKFSQIFNQVYNAIYPETKEQSVFTINDKLSTDAKVEINVDFPDAFSKGKNQGRTLVYDLAVLFYGIRLSMPHFLVHDGIFDGMDKAHFVALYTFLDEMKKSGCRFQYILTVNEEGTLSEYFGDADCVSAEKIEAEAIAIYSPSKKLLKFNF